MTKDYCKQFRIMDHAMLKYINYQTDNCAMQNFILQCVLTIEII